MKIGDAEWRVLADQIVAAQDRRDVASYAIALAVQAGALAHAQQLVPEFAAKDAELDRLRSILDERRKQPA